MPPGKPSGPTQINARVRSIQGIAAGQLDKFSNGESTVAANLEFSKMHFTREYVETSTKVFTNGVPC